MNILQNYYRNRTTQLRTVFLGIDRLFFRYALLQLLYFFLVYSVIIFSYLTIQSITSSLGQLGNELQNVRTAMDTTGKLPIFSQQLMQAVGTNFSTVSYFYSKIFLVLLITFFLLLFISSLLNLYIFRRLSNFSYTKSLFLNFFVFNLLWNCCWLILFIFTFVILEQQTAIFLFLILIPFYFYFSFISKILFNEDIFILQNLKKIISVGFSSVYYLLLPFLISISFLTLITFLLYVPFFILPKIIASCIMLFIVILVYTFFKKYIILIIMSKKYNESKII